MSERDAASSINCLSVILTDDYGNGQRFEISLEFPGSCGGSLTTLNRPPKYITVAQKLYRHSGSGSRCYFYRLESDFAPVKVVKSFDQNWEVIEDEGEVCRDEPTIDILSKKG